MFKFKTGQHFAFPMLAYAGSGSVVSVVYTSVNDVSCATMLPPSLMVFFSFVLQSKRSDAFHKKEKKKMVFGHLSSDFFLFFCTVYKVLANLIHPSREVSGEGLCNWE